MVHTDAEEPAEPEKHTTNNLTVSFRHIPYMSLSPDCSFGSMICQSEILPKVGSSGDVSICFSQGRRSGCLKQPLCSLYYLIAPCFFISSSRSFTVTFELVFARASYNFSAKQERACQHRFFVVVGLKFYPKPNLALSHPFTLTLLHTQRAHTWKRCLTHNQKLKT